MSKNTKIIIAVVVVVGLLFVGGLYMYNESQKPVNQLKKAVGDRIEAREDSIDERAKQVEDRVEDKIEDVSDELEQRVDNAEEAIEQEANVTEGAMEDELQ